MNENELEQRMTNWTPRRPSNGLSRGLFGESPATAPSHRRRLTPGWLIPATAVLCLALARLATSSMTGVVVDSSSNAVARVLTQSNLTLAAYLDGGAHSGRNGLNPGTFEWTNRTPSPSAIRTLPEILSH